MSEFLDKVCEFDRMADGCAVDVFLGNNTENCLLKNIQIAEELSERLEKLFNKCDDEGEKIVFADTIKKLLDCKKRIEERKSVKRKSIREIADAVVYIMAVVEALRYY